MEGRSSRLFLKSPSDLTLYSFSRSLHTTNTHQAHRHPYIEQLGVIYLMKLRYARHFGERAGTCWRLIFVYALMPWLHKYRIQARPKSKRLKDIETQFPSLKFKSLRNVLSSVNNGYPGEDEGEEIDARISADAMTPTFGRGPGENDKKRIRELEEEVQRLRTILATSSPALSV